MKSLYRRVSLILILSAAPLALAAGPALAGSPANHAHRHHAKISQAQARKTALARVPGVVKAAELEKEKGRWIYSFEIKPRGETRTIVKEVNIDADTGAIVEVGTERE